MVSAAKVIEIGADDFARRFSLRSANLMWFLGAGSSASAGVPTAGDMIWEFKQNLFVSQRRVSPQTVADLSSVAVRSRLQAHIDSLGNLPSPGAPGEYAGLFEAVYPAEADRRTYLDAKMTGAKPSFAHIALATLMKANLARLVWTTNFDPLVADACAKVYDSTAYLTTVALDAPGIAQQSINEQRWPIEVKLHGDFRSRRLKNTADELRLQDERLRQIFQESCRRFGLIVAGYSGRDSSIMDTLEAVLSQDGAFPAGLFWLHRGEDDPSPRVTGLLAKADAKGVEAALVRIENFDEAMRDLIRPIPNLDTKILNEFALDRRRWSSSPLPAGRKGWPVIRFNAVPVIQSPTVCRRLVCSIGGHSEVREAVQSSGANILVARTNAGVLGFGSDSDMRLAFQPHGITEFDLHTIETKRLRYDSGERGLLRQALTRAISRHRNLTAMRYGATDLLVPSDPAQGTWAELRQQVGELTGTVKSTTELCWYEGVGIQLDWADDRLWLLLDPRTVFTGLSEQNRSLAADFARERTVKRYNRQLNALIAFWARQIAGDDVEMHALGIVDGVDAVFKISGDTAYSKRSGA